MGEAELSAGQETFLRACLGGICNPDWKLACRQTAGIWLNVQHGCNLRGWVMDTAGKFYFLGFEHILTICGYCNFVFGICFRSAFTNSIFSMEIPNYLVAFGYLIHTAESETCFCLSWWKKSCFLPIEINLNIIDFDWNTYFKSTQRDFQRSNWSASKQHSKNILIHWSLDKKSSLGWDWERKGCSWLKNWLKSKSV